MLDSLLLKAWPSLYFPEMFFFKIQFILKIPSKPIKLWSYSHTSQVLYSCGKIPTTNPVNVEINTHNLDQFCYVITEHFKACKGNPEPHPHVEGVMQTPRASQVFTELTEGHWCSSSQPPSGRTLVVGGDKYCSNQCLLLGFTSADILNECCRI